MFQILLGDVVAKWSKLVTYGSYHHSLPRFESHLDRSYYGFVNSFTKVWRKSYGRMASNPIQINACIKHATGWHLLSFKDKFVLTLKPWQSPVWHKCWLTTEFTSKKIHQIGLKNVSKSIDKYWNSCNGTTASERIFLSWINFHPLLVLDINLMIACVNWSLKLNENKYSF